MNSNNSDYQTPNKHSSGNVWLIVIAAILVAVIIGLVFVIITQNKNDENIDETESMTESNSESESNIQIVEHIDVSEYYGVSVDDGADTWENNLQDYVKLGQYKELEVTRLSTEVTEDDVEDAVKYDLMSNDFYESIEVDDVVKDGDVISLSYVGYMDDVVFDGGTGSTDSLTIGSGAMIPGFESGIVEANVKAGETATIYVTFPDVYPNNQEYAGKKAKFECTINSVKRITYSELTAEVLETIGGYTSVDQYKDALRESIKAEKEENAEYRIKSDLWSKVIDNTEFVKYPKKVLESYSDEMITYYSTFAANYGYTLSDYIAACGSTEEEFYKACAEYAVTASKEKLVIKSIANAEKIVLDDAKYEAGAEKYCELYSYETVEELEEAYGKDVIMDSLISDEVMNLLVETAKID